MLFPNITKNNLYNDKSEMQKPLLDLFWVEIARGNCLLCEEHHPFLKKSDYDKHTTIIIMIIIQNSTFITIPMLIISLYLCTQNQIFQNLIKDIMLHILLIILKLSFWCEILYKIEIDT